MPRLSEQQHASLPAVVPLERGSQRAQRLEVCYAAVKADNRAARGLYARHGFQGARGRPNYYGPGRDGVRLELRLPDARRSRQHPGI